MLSIARMAKNTLVTYSRHFKVEILFMFLMFWSISGCSAYEQPEEESLFFLQTPVLIFETGIDKGEINYSWTTVESDDVCYTLIVLKGWNSVSDVKNSGEPVTSNADAHAYNGTFHGEAGEWYSAVVRAENGKDVVYSEARQAKAKRTEFGEFEVRFAVIADTHLGRYSRTYPLHQRFEKVLDWYNTEDVKAIAIVGDITESGTQENWDTFKYSWEKYKDRLQLIAVAGNHEFRNEDVLGSIDRFEEATGQKTNAHYVIDGYHFIVLSAGAGNFTEQGTMGGAIATGRSDVPVYNNYGDNVSQSLKNWLRLQIDIAKAAAPGKPIFVFFHWSIMNTFYSFRFGYTSSFGNDPYTGFFKDDPEVVIFSGHLHAPNNDPSSIWQGDFTTVNTPSLHYVAMGSGHLGDNSSGMENRNEPKIAGEMAGQGMIVSVKGSKVTIENYDFDFCEGPQSMGNVIKIPQIWEFDVSRPTEFPYTKAKREAQKTAPAFDITKPVNAGIDGIIIKKITDTAVEVEFLQAKIPGPNYGNEVIHSYRFDFINRQTGDIDRSAKQWSDFMLTPRLQKPTYTQLVGGLKPGTDYELRIYAYGSFQECSSQYLTQTFKTTD